MSKSFSLPLPKASLGPLGKGLAEVGVGAWRRDPASRQGRDAKRLLLLRQAPSQGAPRKPLVRVRKKICSSTKRAVSGQSLWVRNLANSSKDFVGPDMSVAEI